MKRVNWTRLELSVELNKAGIYYDSLRKDKNGNWVMRKAFFYTHGNSAVKIADKIKKAIPKVKIVETLDDWRTWPVTSYFVVRFKI